MNLSFRVHKCFLMALALLTIASHSVTAQDEKPAWPQSVLITNDDGINESRLWALGAAFQKVAKTYLIASLEDRSGSSNYTSLGKNSRSLFVRRNYLSENLIAYGVAGYPADCVAFGLRGLLRDDPPDLVISGVNGGANLGDDGWFMSGTIGAARTAAFLGCPAMAVSGLDDDDEEMVKSVTQWIVDFAQTDLVRNLEPGQYLNINFPELPVSEIRGIRIASTIPSVIDLSFERALDESEEGDDETEEVWVVRQQYEIPATMAECDLMWYKEGYIVIVPMQIGENDSALSKRLKDRHQEIPAWPPDGK